MTQQADTSGGLALSPRPGTRVRTAPMSVDSRRAARPATAAPDPAHSAEVAQARLFERLLQGELAELEDHAQRITRPADRMNGTGDCESGVDLPQIRARLDEIRGLLRALRGRFPDSETAPGS